MKPTLHDDFDRQCLCYAWEHCPVCDPEFFAHNKSERKPSRHQKEQQEAAVLETIKAAVLERFRGVPIDLDHGTDDKGLWVRISRQGAADPIKVRIYLEM